MTTETVEITPSGSASLLAQQLLAVAEADPRFTVNDVKTTTFGPMGLAFIVPTALHETWQQAYGPRDEDEAVKPRQRVRNGKPKAEEN